MRVSFFFREAATSVRPCLALVMLLTFGGCGASDVDQSGKPAPRKPVSESVKRFLGHRGLTDWPKSSLVERPEGDADDSATAAPPSDKTDGKKGDGSTNSTAAETAEDHLRIRDKHDQTTWALEVEAQRHEEAFVHLWDELRNGEDEYSVLRAFRFDTLRIGELTRAKRQDLGIRTIKLSSPRQTLTFAQWKDWLDHFRKQGCRLVESEWHHSKFSQPKDGPARSTVNMTLHVERPEPLGRFILRGELDVKWSADPPVNGRPVPSVITLRNARLVSRSGEIPFQSILTAKTDAKHKRVMPLLLYDLDGDGRSEIILGGLNRVYRNEGGGKFRAAPLTSAPLDIFDAAVLADFTGDGRVDLACVGRDRKLTLLEGKAGGRFSDRLRTCADFSFELPKSFTAGDIDGDGDLDLWVGQYKFPYIQGAMPTPFYDANDGYRAVLLMNDGKGNFKDVTQAAGLAKKRNRRTFSSSLVDLDSDDDLDLIVVSDFAGIDIYYNDGKGKFTDVPDRIVDERHHFGMGHTMADFDGNNLLDFYIIGMSSTTARRLDAMKLGRTDHPKINRMRQSMGYGNRMYLARDEKGSRRFVQPKFNAQVARTGWSWGTTSPDFDNDGDRDLYVANGHNSGRSAKDYCTRYWCHDIYTGSSTNNQELFKVFGQSLRELHSGDISWNGFEHNVMMISQQGKEFVSAGFLMGTAFEFDSRAAASDDLDGDGKPDLLVVQYHSERRGHAEYTLHVLKNNLPVDNHWIGLRLERRPDTPSPIGATVTVRYDGGQQMTRIVTGDSFSTQHAPVAHFGLGDVEKVDSLEVRWPGNRTHVMKNPKIDRYHSLPPNVAVLSQPK